MLGLRAPGSCWTSGLQDCERINFCCAKPPEVVVLCEGNLGKLVPPTIIHALLGWWIPQWCPSSQKNISHRCVFMMPTQCPYSHCFREDQGKDFFFSFFFRAEGAALGNSQARGRIRATAACLYHRHSNAGSEPHCNLHHSSPQYRILDPLSEARGRTHILMGTSWICFCYATMGTPG